MPKGQDDYMDKNLSKLYEQERQRHKMSELANEQLKKGESLNSPELLKESSTFNELMLDAQMLDNIAAQIEQDENEEKQKGEETNTQEEKKKDDDGKKD